jgi:hypothetical protein
MRQPQKEWTTHYLVGAEKGTPYLGTKPFRGRQGANTDCNGSEHFRNSFF